MPISTNGKSGYEWRAGSVYVGRKSPHGYVAEGANCVHIGLINNMPDAALEATERQFLALLDAAANGIPVRVSFYALPDVPRSAAARQHIECFYSDLEKLWGSQLDGLIVTGREPRAPDLTAEPYWGSLTRVLEWAEDNTHSTVWSCLAAHAAILYMDGIVRRKSQEKRCGIFDCAKLCDHPLMAGLPASIKMPHSRWNDIPEDELKARGYSVLTRAQGAGADTFIKQRNSLFVFLQGHPEYEADTLMLEYRRDVRRYLTGETEKYPSMPHNYFEIGTADALTALSKKASCGPPGGVLEEIAAEMDKTPIGRPWHSAATRMYGNWLSYVLAQRERAMSGEFKDACASERRVG